MKIKDLYINPQNVCTVALWSRKDFCSITYGLQINGTNIEMGTSFKLTEKEGRRIAEELKKYQQMIIDEIERKEE